MTQAPTRRDVGLHLFIAAICLGLALYGVLMLAPKAFGYVVASFAGGINAGVVIEYLRVKTLTGWKEKAEPTPPGLTPK